MNSQVHAGAIIVVGAAIPDFTERRRRLRLPWLIGHTAKHRALSSAPQS